MDGGVSDREEVDDILPIAGEFRMSVREGERDGSDCFVLGDQPVSPVLDDLGGFNRSKSDLEVPEFLSFEVVIGG